VPVNRQYPIADLLAAGARFARDTGGTLTLEYVLIRGVNDSVADARRLLQVVSRCRVEAKLNIIPFNRNPFSDFSPPSEADLARFVEAVRPDRRLTVTLRRSRGGDIAAACGQLYADFKSARNLSIPSPSDRTAGASSPSGG
jgi:23S rRNA (adenine2503-C2)-methyltransferase